jgi:hypothetical protein
VAAAPIVVPHHQAGIAAESALAVPTHAAAHHAEAPERVHEVLKWIGTAEELAEDVERISEGERGEAKVDKVVIFVVECVEAMVAAVITRLAAAAPGATATTVGRKAVSAIFIEDLALFIVRENFIGL